MSDTIWKGYQVDSGPITPDWLRGQINRFRAYMGAFPASITCHPAEKDDLEAALRALDVPWPLDAWAMQPGPGLHVVWLAAGEEVGP